MSDGIERSAVFSSCRTWRYTLERYWDKTLPHALFVLLNPSTADETYDDPTNRRGQGFARSWGMGGVVFVNLFAYRTPDPQVMKNCGHPIGPDNDVHIRDQADKAGKIILAWGTHGKFAGRDLNVVGLLHNHETWCLGMTKHGFPKHILYLKADTPLERYNIVKEVVKIVKCPNCGGAIEKYVCVNCNWRVGDGLYG